MRRTTVAVGAVVVAAALAAAAIAWWAASRSADPEASALGFLRALSSGDADDVDAALADELAPPTLAAFTGADAFLRDYSLTLSEPDDGLISAHAEGRIGDAPAVVEFVLEESDGAWRVSGEITGALRVATTVGDRVTIGGESFAAGADITLLPAVYTVTPEPSTLLTGSAEGTVTPGSHVDVTLTAAIAPDTVAAAQEHLDTYVDVCTRPAASVQTACGLRIPWAADLVELDALEFQVETRPVLALTDDGTAFAATGGVLVATASGITHDGEPGTFRYRSDDWTLRGSVSFDDGEMVLSVH